VAFLNLTFVRRDCGIGDTNVKFTPLANRRCQDSTRDPNERYVPIADRVCALECYGKHSGAGWYSYPDGKSPERDPIVEKLIEDYSAEVGIKRRLFSADEIQTQLIDEGIAENAGAVDVVKTAGYGFPRWRGGPMHWAEAQGDAALRETLDRMNQASPNSWVCAARYKSPNSFSHPRTGET
jgi:3-hydroxyacyl-CoA dehydrogenase